MANRRPPACLDTLCSPPARQLAYLMHHRLRCHQRSRQVQQGGHRPDRPLYHPAANVVGERHRRAAERLWLLDQGWAI